jgi:redox-sensitive bicupin YhaK (pirin superfamily)
MFKLKKSKDRGYANHGWLEARHTFSFGDYFDPDNMGFSVLRVINEDKIQPGEGFPMHSHKDMEIVTYIVEGAIEHKDTIGDHGGNSGVIQPGEIQRMSAGRGVRHSEFNHFKDKLTHLLQIWILTEKNGIAPEYEQKNFTEKFKKSPLVLIGSRDGREDSVIIHQDMSLFAGRFENHSQKFEVKEGRKIWLQVVKGEISVKGQKEVNLEAGDGLAIVDEKQIHLQSQKNCEFLIFDLP